MHTEKQNRIQGIDRQIGNKIETKVEWNVGYGS